MDKTKKGLSPTTLILIGTVGGIVFGSFAGPFAANLKFIGDIFIRLIQMSVVLLVMTSITTAVGKMDIGAGKMGFHTFKWIICFTVVSAFLGLALGTIIRPGDGITVADSSDIKAPAAQGSLQETLLGFVPVNVIASMSAGTMIPCILFSIFFGVSMGAYIRVSGKKVILEVMEGINGIIMNIIKIVMNMAPVGIFCLLANVSGAVGFKVVIPMGKFLGALLIGDLIQFLIYGPMVGALCKVNPFKMPEKFAKMSIMALTTTSSAICLPTKMEDSVTKFGVSRRVADFTGPITMSMNSNGAVQCYVLAILFISQATGVTLGPYQLAMAILLSILMCMGTIVVPGGMVVTYTFLASSLGLPLESIAILIGIDWFSGMFRTIMNVDVDVLIAMMVSDKMGELDRDVYNGAKIVEYVQG
ncbi:MAG: dicarboxylate/amino acid:cation symporter [Spirochaetaceae bacterium]|nr:dicarboxylate/amino acid:cation symporter [Spirochaetaceae bacterium]